MNHSFLFKAGEWTAKGKYIDENGNQYDFSGVIKITHESEKWINETYSVIQMDEPVEIKHRFEITPFEGENNYTPWISVHPAQGKMMGHFVVFGPSIISAYRTADNMFSGVEYVTKINDEAYQCQGMGFKGEEKSASWSVQLKVQ